MTSNVQPLALATMQGEDAIQKRIEVGLEAVESQIPLFQRLFGQVESQWKSDRSRVTEADLTISREVEAKIVSVFPEDQFFSEETQEQVEPVPIHSEYVWVIDPVDGTNNFAIGAAMCAISLGLLRNGRPVYGFIYDHTRRVVMHGGKGFGAYDGDRKMQPSQRTASNEVFAAFDGFSAERLFSLLQALRGQGFKMRNVGSGTLHLAYTANGLLDGSFSNRVSIWDVAAAIALCEAVGIEYNEFGTSFFPMTEFELKAPKMYYYAGTEHFCRTVERIWKEAGVFPR